MSKVVYIAGRMHGLPNLDKVRFFKAANELRWQGYFVLNPATLPDWLPQNRYMPMCLAMIDAADYVYALNNWTDSPGATLEVQYALYQGKGVIYEPKKGKIE